jgi:DNA-binding transcriptional LysR family regulator
MPEVINLNRLAYFTAVVDTGSFTRAGKYLGITKAVVSNQVAKLEQDIGTTLLVRTTRRLQPTEAGRIFHARCVSILRDAEDAFDELAEARVEPKGVLRITAPYDYGTSVIVPLITKFTLRYPACKIELSLTDETLDLVSANMDLAIRVGWLADSSLQARRIGSFQQLLVGSPDLSAKIADIAVPEDLIALPFIANTALQEPLQWSFSRADSDAHVVRFTAAISINTTPAVLGAVRAGGGLSIVPDFQADEYLQDGRLLHVLPDWHLPSGGIYTVYPAARFRSPKVTAFVDMLTESLRQ